MEPRVIAWISFPHCKHLYIQDSSPLSDSSKASCETSSSAFFGFSFLALGNLLSCVSDITGAFAGSSLSRPFARVSTISGANVFWVTIFEIMVPARVRGTYDPPTKEWRHLLQLNMPLLCLLTLSEPQLGQVCLLYWRGSTFRSFLLMPTPYLEPKRPVLPTFNVVIDY